MTIPELFERVAAKVPEVRPTQLNVFEGRLHLAVACVDHTHAALWRPVDESTMSLAHLLIEAACWRLLPGYSWEEQKRSSPANRFLVLRPDGTFVSFGGSLTEALLLAVERIYEGKL